MVHDARRAGQRLITDGGLRRAWRLWKKFRLLVPEMVFVGSTNFDTRVHIAFSVYSLASTVAIDSQLSYAGFREALIDKTVRTFRRSDPDFPFRGNSELDSQWTLSCDDYAKGDWRTVSAAQVLVRRRRAIKLTAPQIFELTDSVDFAEAPGPRTDASDRWSESLGAYRSAAELDHCSDWMNLPVVDLHSLTRLPPPFGRAK
jgi:hypothetical protein